MSRPKKGLKIITLAGVVIHETEYAYLFNFSDGPYAGESEWVPKSLSEYDETDEELQIEEWFALQKEFI